MGIDLPEDVDLSEEWDQMMEQNDGRQYVSDAPDVLLQVRVDLEGAKPPIWRRLLIPARTPLVKVHEILQVTFDWDNSHLHNFRDQYGDYYGPQDPYGMGDAEVYDNYSLGDFLKREGDALGYWYDFGDDWWHRLKLEKILPRPADVTGAKCIKGKAAAPPDDSGGIWGYYEHLAALEKGPRAGERYAYALDTLGEHWDPKAFSVEDINASLRQLGAVVDAGGVAREQGGGTANGEPTASDDSALPSDTTAAETADTSLDPLAEPPARPDAIDNQIKAALFDAETGGTSYVSDDMDPELLDIFHNRIRAFHENAAAEPIPVSSLLPDYRVRSTAEVRDDATGQALVEELLKLLHEKHVLFELPENITPREAYALLTEDLFAHHIPPPTPPLSICVSHEDLRPQLAAPEIPAAAEAAEAFFLNFIDVGRPLNVHLFTPNMRLGDTVVPRDFALETAQNWRKQWKAVHLLSFAPGPTQVEDDGTVFQFVDLQLEGIYPDGTSEDLSGPGVVQLIEDSRGKYLVVGAMLESFGF